MQVITKKDVTVYFNWSSSALLGTNPTASDWYLRKNYNTIQQVATCLLNKMNYQPKEIYRGILMHDEALTELLSHSNMTYLSFSEDINIAKSFADINGFGSQFGINHLLGTNGYIVTYMPDASEVLFHHSFIDVFPYIKVWNQSGIDGTEKTLEIQKEVTILQPQVPFKNIIKIETNEKILCC